MERKSLNEKECEGKEREREKAEDRSREQTWKDTIVVKENGCKKWLLEHKVYSFRTNSSDPHFLPHPLSQREKEREMREKIKEGIREKKEKEEKNISGFSM